MPVHQRESPNRRTLTALATVTLQAALACAPADTAHGSRLEDAPPTTLHDLQRYGHATNPDTGFSALGSVVIDSDGLLYAFESRALEVRVFDTTATMIRTVGRRGEGPGEFRASPQLGIHGDTLWAIGRAAGLARRVTLFRRNGELLGTHNMDGVRVVLQQERGAGIVYPISVSRDGLFYSAMRSYTGTREGEVATAGPRDTVMAPRVRWDLTGKLIDTVGWEPVPPIPESSGSNYLEVGGNRYYVPRAESDLVLSLNLPDGVIRINNHSASDAATAVTLITRLTLSGDTVYSRSYGYTPLPYDADALDALAWSSARTPGGAVRIIDGVLQPPVVPPDSMAVFAKLRGAMQFPVHQQPFRQILDGHDGTFWLSRYDARALRSLVSLTGGDIAWFQFSEEGRLLRQLVLPISTRIAHTNGDELWTVEPDDMEVPWVVRYRMVVTAEVRATLASVAQVCARPPVG